MSRKTTHPVILGKRRELVWRVEPEEEGAVSGDRRKVYLRPGLKGGDLLETAIHEATHIGDDRLSEKRVARISKAVRQLLWHLGYRRAGEK